MLHWVVFWIVIIGCTAILVPLVIYMIYQAPLSRIGYIRLPSEVLNSLLPLLPKRGLFVDLGCGDGQVLAQVLDNNRQLQGLGIEVNPPVAWLARIQLRRFGSRAKVQRANFLHSDLSSADTVFCYLNHPTMAALEPKLKTELKSGAIVISCDFPLPTKKPSQTIDLNRPNKLGQTLYIYKY